MSDSPAISICIPTYGRARHIGATLESILGQTRQDFEIVVVDDASPDDTARIIQRFSDPRIRFYRNSANLGVPENYNRTLALGRGRFVTLVEDHDILEADYIAETVALLEEHDNIGVAATGIITIAEDNGSSLRKYVSPFPRVVPGRAMLRRLLTRTDCPFSLTAVIRRSLLERLSPWFDARYWWYADIHLWMRLFSVADFGYVARPLLRFRERESGHALDDSFWDTAFCLDRIHRDDWPLLHRGASPGALLDALRYETAKMRSVMGMKAGKIARRELWSPADVRNAAQYLHISSRTVLALMSLVPDAVYHRLRSRRALA